MLPVIRSCCGKFNVINEVSANRAYGIFLRINYVYVCIYYTLYISRKKENLLKSHYIRTKANMNDIRGKPAHIQNTYFKL